MATLAELQAELAKREVEAKRRDEDRLQNGEQYPEVIDTGYEERLAEVAAMRELEARPMPTATRGDIVVGEYAFSTKTEALTMTRAIIKSVQVNGMTDDAQAFFRALAENHPMIREKVGDRPYIVEPNGLRYGMGATSKTAGLFIRFTDCPDWKTDREGYHRFRAENATNAIGLGVDACLQVVSHHQRVKSAARMIVNGHAPYLDYRDHTNDRYHTGKLPVADQVCAICRQTIPLSKLHWDHFPHGFADIFREWRIQMLLRWEDIVLDRSNMLRFDSVELMRSWSNFHKHFAKFRPTCQRCNVTDKERSPLILSEDAWQDWRTGFDPDDNRSKHCF